jgi:hypothetical protein
MVVIFRLECTVDQKGPYTTQHLANEVKELMYERVKSYNHPAIIEFMEEFVKLGYDNYRGFNCGFISEEQMLDWFPEEVIYTLLESNFEIVFYLSKEENTVIVKDQVFFNRYTAMKTTYEYAMQIKRATK